MSLSKADIKYGLILFLYIHIVGLVVNISATYIEKSENCYADDWGQICFPEDFNRHTKIQDFS